MPEELSLGASHVKAHRSAAGGKGSWTQAIGRSPDSRILKVHCLADDHGRLSIFADSRQEADISLVLPLLGAVAIPKRLVADNAYDAGSLRRWLKAVVPSTATRRRPCPLNRCADPRRSRIEC